MPSQKVITCVVSSIQLFRSVTIAPFRRYCFLYRPSSTLCPVTRERGGEGGRGREGEGRGGKSAVHVVNLTVAKM
jgi:hypothetical protein